MIRSALDRIHRLIAVVRYRARETVSSIWRRPVLILVLALAGLVLLLGPIAQWATPVTGLQGKELADVRNSTRQTLLAAVGGLAILAGLVFTARTYYLTRRGQLTNRYATAIEQVASDKMTERLGGIYALEHVMRESSDDHQTIVEVLAAFIRERAPISDVETQEENAVPIAGPPRELPAWVRRPPTDVRAALAVLNRRPNRVGRQAINLELTELSGAELPDAWLPNADLHGANLHLAWLVGALLANANLQGARLTAYLQNAQLQYANLQDACMSSAQLDGANMRQCSLIRADLKNASLVNAQLQGADLSHADLKYASLVNAQLQGADLSYADLEEVNLDGAQLQGANLGGTRGLTRTQLDTAKLDDTTQLHTDYGLL